MLQEIVSLLASLPAGGVSVEGLQKTVAGWCQRWPSVQQPSADACLSVLNVRQLLLDALIQEWPREQQHKGQTLFQVRDRDNGFVASAITPERLESMCLVMCDPRGPVMLQIFF